MGRVVTVFGTRVGIGKTVLATNLAAALAQQTGQRVVLADIALCRYVQVDGDNSVKLLPAPQPLIGDDKIDDEHIAGTVRHLEETHDYVVLDTGSTEDMTDITVKSIFLADTCLLVVPAVNFIPQNARELLTGLAEKRVDVKLALVTTSPDCVPMAGGLGWRTLIVAIPEQVEAALGHSVDCVVPYNGSLQSSIPFVVSHPDSEASQAIVKLARALALPEHLATERAYSNATPQATRATERGSRRRVARRNDDNEGSPFIRTQQPSMQRPHEPSPTPKQRNGALDGSKCLDCGKRLKPLAFLCNGCFDTRFAEYRKEHPRQRAPGFTHQRRTPLSPTWEEMDEILRMAGVPERIPVRKRLGWVKTLALVPLLPLMVVLLMVYWLLAWGRRHLFLSRCRTCGCVFIDSERKPSPFRFLAVREGENGEPDYWVGDPPVWEYHVDFKCAGTRTKS